MSGHNKWSTIRHKKAAVDAKRGKIFTKFLKEITVAARLGGGDPNTNARLRTVLANARAQNMPNENIDRAIKRGTGDLEGVTYESVVYEGYGPSGTAVMIECLTDNKNRTVAEVRTLFTKSGGSMGATNSVGWMFSKKGIILVESDKTTEDKLMEVALDAGADDIDNQGEIFEVSTTPDTLETVRAALELNKIPIVKAEVEMVPSTTKILTGKDAESMINFIERIEDNDDVQHVYSNSEISDEEMSKIA